MRGRRKWLERTADLVTAAVAVVAVYVVATERILPALRDADGPVTAGAKLEKVLEFRGLGAAAEGNGSGPSIRVPGTRPALLLVFASTCPACAANLPAWKQVLSAADRQVRRLAVAIEPDRVAAREYAERYLSEAAAVVPRDPERFAVALGVDVVPFTALVADDGTVAYLRRGRLDAVEIEKLIRALGALSGP